MAVVMQPPATSMELVERMVSAKSAYELGLDFDGCPCFELDLPGLYVRGHCWRICIHCRYCGIHASFSDPGSAAIVERLKELLDVMDWYGEWTLHVHPDREPASLRPSA